MKLCLNKTSPYARLVLVTALETGLSDRIEMIWAEPWNDPPEMLAINPLAKVPAFVADDGSVLIESTCICDYLIALSGREDLSPRQTPARTDMLRRLGFGRATIDCAFGAVIQRRFSNNADTALSQRWLRALPQAASTLDAMYGDRRAKQSLDLGDLTVAVAFDYVDFRLPAVGWRKHASGLARWVDAVRARPSLNATKPP
jgi:glutathione S-transferase